MYPNHDTDVYGWAIHTAQLLREKRMNEVDMDGILEEIEALGRSEKHELTNRLSQLIFHLLKWQHQPDFRGRSWQGSMEEQRIRLKSLLEDNPSLMPLVDDAINKAYKLSFSLLKKETPINLKSLPAVCPYNFDQIMDDDFYPNI